VQDAKAAEQAKAKAAEQAQNKVKAQEGLQDKAKITHTLTRECRTR
jgi:hypothetical protein